MLGASPARCPLSPMIVLSAIGRDRPGIVAGLVRVLDEQGCRLEETSMTRLAGDFAALLRASLPEGKDPDSVRNSLQEEAKRLGIQLTCRVPGEDETRGEEGGRIHRLVLRGSEKPGALRRVAEAAARHGLNITELHSRRSGSGARSVFTLTLQLEVPYAQAAHRFAGELETLEADLGVDLEFEPEAKARV